MQRLQWTWELLLVQGLPQHIWEDLPQTQLVPKAPEVLASLLRLGCQDHDLKDLLVLQPSNLSMQVRTYFRFEQTISALLSDIN